MHVCFLGHTKEAAANKKGFNEALMQAWSKQSITNIAFVYSKMYSARLNALEKKLEKLDKSTKPSSKKTLREGSSFRKIFTRSASKDDTGKGGRGGQ